MEILFSQNIRALEILYKRNSAGDMLSFILNGASGFKDCKILHKKREPKIWNKTKDPSFSARSLSLGAQTLMHVPALQYNSCLHLRLLPYK